MLLSLLFRILERTGLTVQVINPIQQVLKSDDDDWRVIQSNYEPWTSPPLCTLKIEEHANLPDDTMFCMYAQQNFANGRGIVVFTTPSTAQAMVESGQFNNDHSSTTEIFSPEFPLYESRKILGKGFGLVANRTISRGDKIIMESPIVIYDEQLAKLVNKQHLAFLHREGINQLPSETRSQFFQLHKGTTKPTIDDIDNAIFTNAFATEYYEGGNHHVNLYAETSRINHACRAK